MRIQQIFTAKDNSETIKKLPHRVEVFLVMLLPHTPEDEVDSLREKETESDCRS